MVLKRNQLINFVTWEEDSEHARRLSKDKIIVIWRFIKVCMYSVDLSPVQARAGWAATQLAGLHMVVPKVSAGQSQSRSMRMYSELGCFWWRTYIHTILYGAPEVTDDQQGLALGGRNQFPGHRAQATTATPCIGTG